MTATTLKNLYKKYYPYIYTFLFLILNVYMIYHDVLSRDVAHSWYQVALGSNSIQDFINKMQSGEGTPFLWNFLLYLISRVTDNVIYMRILHLAISTTSTFLFLRFFPLNRVIKILFTFSYFNFYEYSVQPRNYAIGVLFIWVFCILYKNKYKNIFILMLVACLASYANIFSCIISIFLLIHFLLDILYEKNINNKKRNELIVIFSTIFIIATVALQLGRQFIDNPFVDISLNGMRKTIASGTSNLKNIPRIFIGAYLPIPVFTLNFWDSNIIYQNINLIFSYILSLFLFITPLFIINKKVFTFYLSSTLSIVLFYTFIYGRGERHLGHIFIIFIISLWLSEYYHSNSNEKQKI